MSIEVLKRKTQAKYNNNSVGFSNFSLVGTHRSQGWVGQTSLSRSLPKTVMKGNVAKGYGGCCGQYIYGTVVNSAVKSENNSNIVKKSSMTTSGLLEKNYSEMVVSGPNSCVTWKPDYNTSDNNSQNSYISFIKEQAIQYADSSACAIERNYPSECYCEPPKEDKKTVDTMSQSTYLDQLKSKCYDTSYNVFYVANNTINNFTFCGNESVEINNFPVVLA